MSDKEQSKGKQPARKSRTWTEQAYDRLRMDILSGALRPGTRLKIEELKQRYDLGPTPLREALSRLNSEGLVQSEQLKGYRVAAVSLRELEELCDLRVMIEGEALRRAMEKGDEEWEGDVVSAFHKLDRMEQRLADGEKIDPGEWEDRNRDFHAALVSAADSQWLLRTREHLWVHHERYRRYARILLVDRPVAHVRDEHRSLMESALARDSERAVQVIRDHILFTVELLRDRFR